MQIIFSLVFCLFSATVWAQATEDNATGSTSTTNSGQGDIVTEDLSYQTAPTALDKIQVTGSYIKRVDEEAPTPVQTISKETLKKSGYNSVADVMRDNAITSGGQREDSGNGNPGAATTGIGPFGADSILVLLDGNRMPKIGGDNSVDLNLIPMAAIERIEILKDGASALYGSDAIGGVINFITKKDYNGGSVSLGQMASGQGDAGRTDFTGTFGKTFEKGSITGVMQYRHNDHLADKDRDYTRVTNLGVQGSGTAQEAQWFDANNDNQAPNCPAEQMIDGFCMYDYSAHAWNLPQINQYSTLLNGYYKITPSLKSRTQATYTYRTVDTRFAPAPGRIKVDNATATALGMGAFGPLNPGDTTINYRLADGGTRDNDDKTGAFTIAETLEGKIAGTWGWDLTGSMGYSRTRQDGRGYADTRKLMELIQIAAADGPGGTAGWNPIRPAGQKGDLSSALITPYAVTMSRQSEVRAVTSGQITETISSATGVTGGWQKYLSEVDEVTRTDNSWGGNGSSGEGSRAFHSVFQEFSMFPVESLEIGLAARYDNYNDFGNTFNPKLSLSWQASEKLMLRSSIGTGFRAPNLSDLYAAGTLGYPTFRDPIGCANTGGSGPFCAARQYEVSTFANRNLQEERSIFMNFGFLAQPKKNWNVESNIFYAEIDDQVGGLDETQMMRAADQFGEAFLKEKYNITIIRDGGTIQQIIMPSAFNIASSRRKGLDLRVTNQSKANIGSFPIDMVFDMTHIQFLKMERESFPGLGIQRTADGEYFGNYFKNAISVSAIHNDHVVRTVARTISGGDKFANRGTPGDVGYGKLRSHTEFDLTYSLANIVKNGTFTVGLKNVFDTPRPLDETNQRALNASIYDPIGRYAFTNFEYTF